MAISLGDIKKKKTKISTLEEGGIKETASSIAPISRNNSQSVSLGDVKSGKTTVSPITSTNKTHAQEYNLNGTKKIPITVSMTNNNILNEGAKSKLNSALKEDISKTTKSVALNQNNKQIDLSGKSSRGTTPVTEEGLEAQRNYLMSNEELKQKREDLKKQLIDYKREEKVKWWDKNKNLGANLKNVLYKTFVENQNKKYVEDEEYNKLLKKYEMTDDEWINRMVNQQSPNMSTLDKMTYTITGNLNQSTKGIDTTIHKLTGQEVPNWNDTFDERMAAEARSQTKGVAGAGLDVLGSMSRMLPQMLVSGGVGSEAASLAVGFANYGGSAYNDAKKQGATEKQATAYGLTIGSLEMGLEKLLGGMEGVYGKSVLGKTTNKIMTKVISNPAFRNVLSNATGEFTEEYLQEFLEPIVKNVILEEDNGADFWNSENLSEGIKRLSSQLFNSQNLYAGTLGAISSATLGGPSAISHNVNINNEISAISEKINTTNVNENISALIEKGYDIETSVDIVNNALKRKGIQQVDKQSIISGIKNTQNNLISQQNISGNINNTIEQNSSNNLTKKEIKTIAEEVNNQQEKKLSQTVNMPKENRINVVKNSKSFSEQVDDVINNKIKNSDMIVVLKETPNVLQQIGLSNLPITMTQRHLKTIMNSNGQYKGANYHDLGADLIKQIPDAISHPLNILQSDTRADSIVVITELADKQDRPIIASIKIDGTGQINDIEFDSNVMTSAYGRNNYDEFMKKNIAKGNLLYDRDEGITKKSSGKLQLRPTTLNNQVAPTDKIDNQSVNRFVEQPVSDNNDTTKTKKSQVAPISSQYSMQQNEKNDTKKVNAPIAKKKNTINEKIKNSENTLKVSEMSDKQLKDASKTIAERINKNGGLEMKQRSWVKTATESEILDGAVSINDLDSENVYYTPTSNKTTLQEANSKLNKEGYEGAIEYIKNKMSSDERVKASDVALAERLIQEAVKTGDMKTAQELIMDAAILGTEYGRTIQALSIIQRLTPEGQLKMLEKIVSREKSKGNKTFEGVEITPEMVEKVLKAYNENGTYDQNDLNKRVEEVKQEIANQLKTTFVEKADAWRYLSMLGNPKTHIRNIVSNVAMKGAVEYKNALARTIETVIPIKNRTKTWKKSSEQVKKFAKQKTTELRDVISGETKYSEKTSIEAKKTIFKTKFLEGLYNTNSNLLDLEDWLFSKSAFEKTFREYLTAQGIETEADIKSNPKIIEEAQNYSIEQAQIATFRQYSKLASQINQIERNNKTAGFAIKSVIPFKKTPINIAKAGVNYSPLGLIKNLSYDIVQVSNGNMEASQYIDNLSQGLSGSTLAVLGYMLAKSGILKGDDDNDKKSKYDSALGNKAYTIKLGNNYYSLSWLSPVGMPLFVGANAYKQLEESKDIDMNVVTDMLVSTVNPISEMSLVSSLTDTLKSYSSNGSASIQSMGEKAIKSYIGQYFPTLLSQIASVIDSEKRSTSASSNSKWKYGEEVLNSIKYKIPGLRQTLPAYTDSWGNTQKQADNIFLRAWETFIAPYTRYDDKATKLDKEIMRVYYETGNTNVIPGTPNSYIRYKNEQYKFNNKEYQKFRKTYGETANNYLTALTKKERYKSATDEDKAKMIDKVYDYALASAQSEYFKNKKIDFEKSETKKIDQFKNLDYSYSEIADYIISNYYKYKRTK